MNIIYSEFSKYVLMGTVVPEKEVFKIALFTNEYEPSSDHTSYTNIRGYEAAGSGYSEGGKYISLAKLGTDSNYLRYGANTIVKWTCPNIAFKYAVIYKEDNGMLAACYDLGDRQTSEESPEITLDWTSSYLISFSIGASGDYNVRKIRDQVYEYILEDPDEEIRKSVHEYIKENSDTELDSESDNTIQNKAVINSVEGLDNADIDSMFD